jgi:hypothetical protein
MAEKDGVRPYGSGMPEWLLNRHLRREKPGRLFGHLRKPPECFGANLHARVGTQDQPSIPLQSQAPASPQAPVHLK